MCDCITKVDQSLAPYGGRLAMGFLVDDKTMSLTGRLLLQTVKNTDGKRKRVPQVWCIYCPFCGVKVTDPKPEATEG